MIRVCTTPLNNQGLHDNYCCRVNELVSIFYRWPQLEEEKSRLIETQRRLQEEALTAASADAARAAEKAAAASARAAAADAIREVANAAEQEEFKKKAQKIRVRVYHAPIWGHESE